MASVRRRTNRSLTDLDIIDHFQSLASGPTAHGDVILLASARGNAVDRRWMAKYLVLRDYSIRNRRLTQLRTQLCSFTESGRRALRNHEARVQASFEREKRR